MTECECPNIYNKVDLPTEDISKKITEVKEFIINEFIHGGHLAALSVMAIALSAIFLFNMPIKFGLLITVYLLTLCVYSYDHYKEIKEDSEGNKDRAEHLKKYNKILPLLLISYGAFFLFVLFYFGTFGSMLVGLLLLFSGLLYTEKFKKITEKIAGFKNIYTSFSISSLVVLTAVYYSVSILTWSLILIFAILFLRLMINTSFCDIKDIDSDKKNSLLTLPIVFGKKKFLRFLHIINFSFAIPLIFGIYIGALPVFSLFLLISSIYSFLYIYKTEKEKTDVKSISSTLVDGEFIIWPVLLFIGRIFIAAL